MGRDVIREIAKRHGVSPEEVRAEMEQAIGQAFAAQAPKARKLWGEVAPDGTQPTPEEFISRVAHMAVQETERRKQGRGGAGKRRKGRKK